MEDIYFETDCTQEGVHLHRGLEMLFALSGRVAVTAGGGRFVLEPEGVLVFNPFETHQITREPGGHSLSLYISAELLGRARLGHVHCCSALQPEKAVYLEILRDKLAALFLEWRNPASNGLYRLSHAFSLLGVLRQEFETGGEEAVSGDDGAWLGEVLSYLRENLGERLTLQRAAQAFYLSPGHFSRKFQRLTGQPFSDFLRDLRLKEAESLLAAGCASVTDIASQCGFSNPNTFIHAFQQQYGATPGKYRRLRQVPSQMPQKAAHISYMSLTRHTSHDDRSPSFRQKPEVADPVRVDAASRGKPLCLPHNYCAGAGYASDLLLEPIQRSLRRAVKEVGFRYISLSGILNKSMDVYHTGPDGSLRLNFNYVDMVMDFITTLPATPWLRLDCTPPELAEGEKNFFGQSCMTLPADLARWEEVITGLLAHLAERYGSKEVATWHFSMEQAVYEYYGVFTLEGYQAFYLSTFRAIRRVLPHAYISGFGLDAGICTLPGNDALLRLLRFARENNCLPDELSFQSFGCDYAGADLRKAERELIDHRQDQLEEPVPVSFDPDLVKHQLVQLRETLEAEGFGGLPVVYFIMTSTIWQRDMGNDTCFKAAWIIKNMAENSGSLLGGAVSLTEFSERTLMNPNVFHGGTGVMSFLGFPKAGYHALCLLSRFHGDVVAQGDGYCITRLEEGEGLMLMLYHYCHYDRDTHLSHQLPAEEQRIYDRYYGFEKKGPRSFQFMLEGMAQGLYEADTYLINRSFGSTYDIWMGMGAPERFTPQQREYLERMSVPKYQYQVYSVGADGRLLFSVLLEPHEVRLIHLKKK